MILTATPVKLAIIIIVVVIVIASFLICFLLMKRKAKMKREIINKLEAISLRNNLEQKLSFSSKTPYQLVYEHNHIIYYIKVVENYQQFEIVINNPTTYQIVKNPAKVYTDMNFVKGIKEFIDFKPNNSKNYKKVVLIYPLARALMQYINECEMRFVYNDIDISGVNVVNFNEIDDYFKS